MVDVVNAPVNRNGMTPEQEAEHAQKMAAVADENATRISSKDSRDPDGDRDLQQNVSEGDDNQVPQRPADIPEKFWDAEKGEVNVPALLKAQQDAETALRQSQGKPKPDDQSGDEPSDDAEQTPAEQKQTNVVADATAEFQKDGKLSDETYKSLEGVGLSKDYVDTYIAGQQALIAQMESAVYGPFEGRDGYEEAADWAAKNLSEDEIQALDVQIQSTNPSIAAQGAKALAEKYRANANVDPSVTLRGDANTSPVNGQYYRSSAEMQKDMADPRYKSDPAFRADVMRKIDRADKAGVKLFG